MPHHLKLRIPFRFRPICFSFSVQHSDHWPIQNPGHCNIEGSIDTNNRVRGGAHTIFAQWPPAPMTPARGVTTIHGSGSLSLAGLLRTSEAMSSPCIVVTPLAGVMGVGRHGGGASWRWGGGIFCKKVTPTP